ncbi:MAG: glycosyltransferase family 9 protein [Deltaproteobacteria bacterium]|nr:glycosyltransferase family 9 protein [Deltaproteobacteria bacterium]
MRKALVVRFSSLGDIVLTFPAVNALRQAGGTEIHYLTKESYADLVRMNGAGLHIHTISNHASLRELVAMVLALKQQRFNDIYDLHRNVRSRIVLFLLSFGAPTVVRSIRKFRMQEWFLFVFRRRLFKRIVGRDLGRAAEALSTTQGRADVEGRRSLLETGALPTVGSGQDSQPKFGTRKYVCISMESAWPQKQWPAQRFIEIAKGLRDRGLDVVWLGVKPLSASRQGSGDIDLTVKTDLPHAAAVLKNAELLVCNDSGLMHLAEAVGTPVVAIFGPTSRELGFAPALPSSRIVEVDLWCRPCSKTGRLCIRPIQRRKCLMDIDVTRVWSATLSVLTARQNAAGQKVASDLSGGSV